MTTKDKIILIICWFLFMQIITATWIYIVTGVWWFLGRVN